MLRALAPRQSSGRLLYPHRMHIQPSPYSPSPCATLALPSPPLFHPLLHPRPSSTLSSTLSSTPSSTHFVTPLFPADGDGLLSKAEFKRALKELGYEAPKAELDLVFGALDQDGRYADARTHARACVWYLSPCCLQPISARISASVRT